MDEADLRRYIAEASSQPWLSAAEEAELVARMRDGDAGARAALLRANMPLVVSIARRYEGGGLSLSGLIESGHAGLERAMARFDTTKGFRFSSWAYWWIRQAVVRALADT